MKESTPSQTAAGVALLRAAHQLLDGPPRILDDPITPRLLDPAARDRMLANVRDYMTPERMALRSHLVLRSRYAEDRLCEAVDRGVSQYVLLGAGLDTFGYRQPQWARALRIFEIDHPASQQWKRDRLAAAGLAPPDNLVYVSADFERDDVASRLAQAGLDPARPAFMSCLGVLMYLREPTVRSLLALAGGQRPGSQLVFTYSSQGKESRLAQAAAVLGEPWRSEFAPAQWSELLGQAGFGEVELVSPQYLTARYFQGREDGLPPPRRATIGWGRV